jgi:alkanesulfonate monooxygenase SsuD/methylene tetrahydromethanopterin reductase-like flavin-dependent oxidoreductase (luciferase family)
VVATFDVVSSGRAILGVGAGWSKTEFDGFSEWNDARTRVDKTEEGVQLIKRLWTEDRVGGGSPRMLRMAGRYADGLHRTLGENAHLTMQDH